MYALSTPKARVIVLLPVPVAFFVGALQLQCEAVVADTFARLLAIATQRDEGLGAVMRRGGGWRLHRGFEN
jgi:hypothetical protein